MLGSKQEGKTGSEVVEEEEAGLVFEVANFDADQVGEVKLVVEVTAEAIVQVAKEHMLAMTKSTWAPGKEAILKKLRLRSTLGLESAKISDAEVAA